MKLRILAACGVLAWVGFATQAPAQGPGSRGSGTFVDGSFAVSLARAPGSLDEMIASSKLIVEATVISAFPATRVGGGPVSTDFVLEPRRTLKGQVATDRFVINQLGGELEGRRHFTRQYPGELMSPGQRYILFLNDPNPRGPVLPTRDALTRFSTSFSVLGVVLVEQGAVELSKDLSFRDNYSDMSAEKFMAEIASRTTESSER